MRGSTAMRGGTLSRALACAAAGLLFLSACSGEEPDGEAASPDDGAGEADWAVACTAGAVPIEGIGSLELPCLGDDVATAVGTDGARPMIVVLWASWCQPCAAEAPEVEAFFSEYGDQVGVLGVDTADTAEAGRWFASEFAMTYPSVFDADETIRTGLGVPALPGVAFVAPDGTVEKLITEPGITADSLAADAESAFGLELT
ncbi:TlpA family protein disulfide reductase [Glycomyces buryatensis]|nr:TlpA disulfide reductase family protein [Glycomyces buryatensis]